MIQRWILGFSLFVVENATADAMNIQAEQGGVVSSMLLFTAIFVMFYFLMIRPQNKKHKEQREMLNRLAVGDEVVTTGGIVGKIIKVTDAFYVLTISEDVDILIQRSAISMALPKGTIKAL